MMEFYSLIGAAHASQTTTVFDRLRDESRCLLHNLQENILNFLDKQL